VTFDGDAEGQRWKGLGRTRSGATAGLDILTVRVDLAADGGCKSTVPAS